MAYSPTNMHRAIRSHSVFIYELNSRANGSGVLVEIGGRYFVLTAAHVIKAEVNLHLDIPLPTTRFTIINKWFDSEFDVGYLELKPFEVQTLRGEDSSPFRIGSQKEANVKGLTPNIALCGFARVFSTRIGDSELIPMFFLTIALLPFERWPETYQEKLDPETHFLLSYGPKRGGSFRDAEKQPIPTPDPHGMSGSGVWYFDHLNENSEKPAHSLIGIQHTYDEFYQVLQGTYLTPIVRSLSVHSGISIPKQ